MKHFTLLLALLTVFGLSVNAQITTYPYAEDFEGGAGGWTTAGTLWALGTPAGTVINTASSGVNSWATGLATDYPNTANATITSPIFDFTAVANPAISMNIWWSSEFSWDGTVLQSSIDGGTTWQNIGVNGDPNNWFNDATIGGNPGGQQIGWTGTGANSSNGWVTASHALTGLGGNAAVQLRFAFGSDGSGTGNGFAFDDISVTNVTCVAPSALTATAITSSGANLGFTDNAAAGLFNIEYGTTGFVLGAGTPITGTTNNPETVSGLLPATTYQFYVQTNCGAGGLSTWSGPFAFTTLCATVTPDYTQAFNTFLPTTCWSEANTGTLAAGPSTFGAGNWGAGTTIGNTAKINLFSNNVSDWTLSPYFDLSIGGYEVLLDVAVTNWNAATADVMGSDDQITLAYSEDGITWSALMSWTVADALPNTLTTYSALIPSTATNVQFGILASDGTVNDAEDYDFHFDNFVVRTPPACLDASALMAANITSTGADLSWTDNAGAGLFNVEYGTTGFVLGAGTPITGTTNTTESITGLTAATPYEFYVQVDCGGGNLSAWVGPFSFLTGFNAPTGVTCGAGFATMVFSDDMEANNGWTGNIGTAAGTWDFATTAPGGNSTGTGPSGPASGTTYTEYEASGSSALASMVSPMIDLSSGSSEAELSFYMHAFGTEIGTLNVGVGTSAAGPFTTEFSWTGQYQTTAAQAWEQIGVDLTSYLGQQIYIEFAYAATGPGFSGDLAIDLVQVETCVTCPAPTNFNLLASDLTSGDFDWTENGSALEWLLEYDAPGFTPGAGTDFPSIAHPQNIGGLTSNSFYDIYVRSVCAPGDTSALVGPITFNTYNQGMFMDADTDCGPGFNDISTTGVVNLLGDDGEVGVALPFPLLYQGTIVNDATIGSNGAIVFGTQTAQVAFTNGTMAAAANGLYPFWDDLGPEETAQGEGVFYETIGTAPNQQFIVQWNKDRLGGDGTYIFQLTIDEATQEMWYAYDVVDVAEPANDYGLGATIGAAGPNQDIQLSFNNAQYLTDNACAHFFYTDCPNPLNYTVTYTTVDEAGITWNAGLAGETDWTIIYGPAGFDPLTSGTTVTSTIPALIIPGLDDITEYDVYIYADCNPGVLQSSGATGSFTTLPNCADVTGLGGLTATDSIFTSWSFVENPGFPSTGFDIEYGFNGYTQGMGTIVNADNNFTDTTADVTLLSGTLYDVYVQTICGTDSSNFIGPFTVTMPLDNDSTCLSETLVVDGTVYTFDKTGATAQLNEVNITPPVTGYNTNDGWGQTGLNYSTWFTFEAPASGQVRIDGTNQGFAGQMAVYDVTDCADFATFTLMGANDNAITGPFSSAPNFTVCGLTPGNTYYLMHDANSTTSTTSNGGIYSVALTEVVVEGGTTNGMVDICVGDTVDLFSAIAGYDNGGTWYQETPTLGLNGSTFVSAGLAYQVFNFQYEVVDGCAMDSVVQQVQIYGPSSAGTDGTVTACQNEPIDLLMGLGGNVDLGGTWYNPSNNVTTSNITASSIPGSFNYDYITGNGVCPDDTANVIVSVDPSCDYLSIEEVAFENMSIFPNPTNGSVFVTNEGSNEVFNFELTDVNGKVIVAQNAAINGTETTEVSLTNLETGFYLIRVFNDNADKTFRIIKE